MAYTPPSPKSQITTQAKDQLATTLNPLTGQLDMVQKFEPNRIITHSLNPAGNPMTNYDPMTSHYFPADDEIVTDSQGNVVTT